MKRGDQSATTADEPRVEAMLITVDEVAAVLGVSTGMCGGH